MAEGATGATPTIKGIFVLSHIRALERAKGSGALEELKKRYGKPIDFKNSENVPLREEITIIEHTLDLMTPTALPPTERTLEAGKLHFRNFSGTPLGRLVLPFFKSKFKLLMMNADNVAGHVFNGVRFHSEDKGPREVRIIMDNNDYPLEHFQGFFEAWLEFSGLKGEVSAEDLGENRYEYIVTWS
jgi:uncharacterized protein (TIGR02265 family)